MPFARTTKCKHFHVGAPAIGISVKAGSVVTDRGSFIQINMHGSCHQPTAPGVHRGRHLLDGHDGWLAGLQRSSLPGGHGTHADSVLLYVVSTTPCVQHALLSKVPLQQLQGFMPKECYTGSGLKLPISLKHQAWGQLYDIFERVRCELAAGDGHAFCSDMQSEIDFKVPTGAALG